MISEETRKRLSESHKGKKRTKESIKKFKKTMRKRWADPEFRKMLSETHKGRIASEETRLKISKANIKISSEQEKIIMIYYASGLSANEIKAILNIGVDTIYGCLRRNGIKFRKGGHLKGRTSPKKGIRLSKEQKKKLNIKGLELGRAWNKGKIGCYSEEHLEKMRIRLLGKVGKKALNWQGGISRAYKTGYGSIQYKKWRQKVFERDNYICQKYGIHSGNGQATYLTAHHIKSFSKYPKLRFDVNNGITLCELCHCKIDKYRARFMNLEAQIV